MDTLRTGVFVLFALCMPVCSAETFFTDPVICYFLDAFLMVYCIAATALFFREKFSKMPPLPSESNKDEKGGIYQELERPKDTDQYEVLNPKKAKGKTDRKKKPKKNQGKPKEKESYESVPTSPQPILSP